MMQEEVLSKHILEQVSQNDEEVKKHIALSQKHHCDFAENTQLKWLMQQVKKMDVKIHDPQYGKSIEQIIENRQRARMQPF